VKLRGQRIELGEVESALGELPGVAGAAVVLRGEGANRRLVAYLALAAGAQAESAASPLEQRLRQGLSLSLPEYMLPSQFIVLSALPLTDNGKIDRRALAALPEEEGTRAYVAPRTELEAKLAKIWQELLCTERVSVNDSFFELGGHSLLAVRLAREVEELMGVRPPLSLLFQFHVLEELAVALEERVLPEPEAIVTLHAGSGDAAPVYCLHPTGGHTLAYRGIAAAFSGSRSVYGIQARSFYDDDWIDGSIAEVVRSYADEMEGHDPARAVCLIGWSFGGPLAIELAREWTRRGHRVLFLGVIDPSDLLEESPQAPVSRRNGDAGPPDTLLRDADVGAPDALAAWMANARLAEKWQALHARADAHTRQELLRQFGERKLAERPLGAIAERELFHTVNSWMTRRGYRLEPLTVPAHAWWSTDEEGRRWRQQAEALLADRLPLGGSIDVTGDHFAMLKDPELARAIVALIDRLERSNP
jgi:thioesterase domain-containing protein/acyl carrier protein